MGIRVTDRFWPIVVLELHGTMSPEDIDALDTFYAQVFARSEPFVAWSDLRGLRSVPGPAERQRVAAWMRRIEGEMRAQCLGSSNLVRSPIIRGVMTALYWMFTPPVPQAFPAHDAEALEWCAARLQDGGYGSVATLSELASWREPDVRSTSTLG